MIVEQFWAYFKLFHPYTSIAVSIITMIIALPLTVSFNEVSLVLMGLAMLCIQFSIGLSNDLLDREYDKKAKPWKSLVTQKASLTTSKFLLLVLVLLSFVFIYPLGILPSLILYFGFSLGLLYNLGFKRTILSWLPYSLSLPTVMVYARIIHGDPDFFLLLLLYPLGLLAGPALNIANQLPEAKKAKESGETSLVHFFGPNKSAMISTVLLLSLIFLSIISKIIFYSININSLLFFLLAFILLIFYYLSWKIDKVKLLWPCSILIAGSVGLAFLQ